MVRGSGIDIIEISRIRKSVVRYKQTFLDRLFTEGEQQYCYRYRDPIPHFAGRFAAKEAIVKALGSGFQKGISWHDIEIRNDAQGKPQVLFSPKAIEFFHHPEVTVSITHCKEYAAAIALYL